MTEQAAIDAVARHFSVQRRESATDSLMVQDRRVALTFVALEKIRTARSGLTLPRLRFDRVALRVIEALRARLGDFVPHGKVLVVTVTAPIRLAAKTVDAIEKLGRTNLNHPRSRVGIRANLHGNKVRLHLVKSLFKPVARVIAFVHNPDSDTHLLLGLIESLLFSFSDAVGRLEPRNMEANWLILQGGQPEHLATYRHIYDQLGTAINFEEIVMVFDGGRVESLTP